MKQPGCMRRNMTLWLRLRVDDIEVAGWSPRGFMVAAESPSCCATTRLLPEEGWVVKSTNADVACRTDSPNPGPGSRGICSAKKRTRQVTFWGYLQRLRYNNNNNNNNNR